MYHDILDGQNCKRQDPIRTARTWTANYAPLPCDCHLASTNTPCARWKSHIWDIPISHCNLTLVSHAHIYRPLTGWIYKLKPTIIRFATPNAGGRPALNSDLHSPLFLSSSPQSVLVGSIDRSLLLFLVVFQKEIVFLSTGHVTPVSDVECIRPLLLMLHLSGCIRLCAYIRQSDC